jgi:hypothetical protein
VIEVGTGPDEVLARFWHEARQDGRIAELAALVPADRALTVFDAIPLLPLVMRRLGSPADQVALLDVLAHAYARAAGLHFSEE